MKTVWRLAVALLILELVPAMLPYWGAGDVNDPVVGDPTTAWTSYERWKRTVDSSDAVLRLPLSVPGILSAAAVGPSGVATLDLSAGSIDLSLVGVPADSVDLWVVDRRGASGEAGSLGAEENRVHLGRLALSGGSGSLTASLATVPEVGFQIDSLEVTRSGAVPSERVLLAGSPSLFQRLYYGEQLGRPAPSAVANAESASPRGAGSLAPFAALVPRAAQADAAAFALAVLVFEGEKLFFNETFGGNGRTCGTCHPAENNFTIDPAFIATLPSDDPLFIAEFNPALSDLENPQLMREFGLILANVDGLEDPTQKFVMRSVPHILGLSMTAQTGAATAPFEAVGWSGDGAPGGGRLRDFTQGAIAQHFPHTLARVPGEDFRLATEHELDALEAFMLSVGRRNEFDIEALRLTNADAEEGRALFIAEDSENQTVPAAKCNLCHRNAGALTIAGVNRSFDTGIEDMPHPADATGETRPLDGGLGTQLDPISGSFGDGRFNVASLWEAADTAPYFHHNSADTLEDAIRFYDSPEFKDSEEGQFILAFDTGGQELSVEIDQLAAFLRVLNTLENVRSASDYLVRAHRAWRGDNKVKLLDLATAEINDAIEVLEEGDLHPEVVSKLLEAVASTAAATAAVGTPVWTCNQSDSIVANGLMSGAILETVVARDLMIAAPLVQLDDPVPTPELEPEPEPEPEPETEPPPPPVCTIYGCTQDSSGPPVDPGTPPDPTMPANGNSPGGEAIGIVSGRNLSSMHVMISTPEGDVTLQITSGTVFKGNVAANLGEVVVGHEVEASFFIPTNEVVSIETNFPDVF